MKTVVTKGEEEGEGPDFGHNNDACFLVGLSMRNFVANSFELCLAHFIC